MNAVTGHAAPEAVPTQGIALVPAEQRATHYARIIAAHDADRAREHRKDRGRAWLIGGLIGANLCLAGAVVAMMPLKELRPVFVTINSDGTFATTINQRDVPQSLREATIKATLWLYTRSREGFSTAGHHEDQRVVYMLSDKATGDAYEQDVSLRNPQSPWRRHGTRTTVRVERVSEEFVCARADCLGREPDAYQVRFRRITRTEGQREVSVAAVATIRFRVADRIPQWQRVTYNPMGLQVVEYTTTDEGAGS